MKAAINGAVFVDEIRRYVRVLESEVTTEGARELGGPNKGRI